MGGLPTQLSTSSLQSSTVSAGYHSYCHVLPQVSEDGKMVMKLNQFLPQPYLILVCISSQDREILCVLAPH